MAASAQVSGAMGQLTLKHYGVDAEKLPKPELDELIRRNKVTDVDSPE